MCSLLREHSIDGTGWAPTRSLKVNNIIIIIIWVLKTAPGEYLKEVQNLFCAVHFLCLFKKFNLVHTKNLGGVREFQ